MFVKAPRRIALGTTTESMPVYLRSDPTRYTTIAEAQLRAKQLTYTSSTLTGETGKVELERGITQWREYKNTRYRAVYHHWTTNGRVETINRNGAYGYQPEANQFVWRGDTAQFGNGLVQRVTADCSLVSGTSAFWYLNNGVINNLVNRAKAECLIKAKDKTLDMSEILVDLPETVMMVALRSIQVMRAFRYARKRQWDEVFVSLGLLMALPPDVQKRMERLHGPRVFTGRHDKKVLERGTRHWKEFQRTKGVDRLWLELQYGWLPLLSDIHSGVELASKLLNRNPTQGHFTAVRRLTAPLLLRNPDYNPVWLDAKASAEALARVEVRYRWRVSDAQVAFLDSLGLQNPLYVAWISVPMSFVVDWIAPVSTWLESLSAPLGLQFTSGYVTRQSWGRSEIHASQRSTSVYSKVYESGATFATHERLETKREVLYSFPITVPYIRLPSLEPARIATAVSLITSTRKH